MIINKEIESKLKELIYNAGELAIEYRENGLEVINKPDNSPVSNGDVAVSNYIYQSIQGLNLGYPIICEEQEILPIDKCEYFWLIDPIDGTRSYIKNRDTFTVNIALIHKNKPIFGYILQPSMQKLYYSSTEGELIIEVDGVKQEVKPRIDDKKIVIVSSNHFNSITEQFIMENSFDEIIALPSSLKLCYLAEGVADIYPKFSPTMEWDIAAGHAIINAAGGEIKDLEGEVLKYGKSGFANPHFIAFNNRHR